MDDMSENLNLAYKAYHSIQKQETWKKKTRIHELVWSI